MKNRLVAMIIFEIKYKAIKRKKKGGGKAPFHLFLQNHSFVKSIFRKYKIIENSELPEYTKHYNCG